MAKDIEQIAEEKYPISKDEIIDSSPQQFETEQQMKQNDINYHRQQAYLQCYRDHCLPVVEENKRLREALENFMKVSTSDDGSFHASPAQLREAYKQAKSALSHVPDNEEKIKSK